LFSGIGGLDLGLERAGLKVIWQSEIDPYCCKVLKKHWPEVPNHGDITTIKWATVQRPDVICGGYPCQPFSVVGKRHGAKDHRHLWPFMFNAIRDLRPKYAILENVRGHLSLGFGTVLGDLASIGFNAEWRVLRATDVGAPHRRERVFVVAYSDGLKLANDNNGAQHADASKQRAKVFGTLSASIGIARTNGHWLREPRVARVANGVSNRVDRLRGLGNAVVPQIGELLGRCINDN
jgi:DNA (cytosine-5)-methyltransferase 1